MDGESEEELFYDFSAWDTQRLRDAIGKLERSACLPNDMRSVRIKIINKILETR